MKPCFSQCRLIGALKYYIAFVEETAIETKNMYIVKTKARATNGIQKSGIIFLKILEQILVFIKSSVFYCNTMNFASFAYFAIHFC